MQKKYKNKMIEEEKNKKVDETEEEYFFPEFQITIKAKSREEAEAKLKAEISKREK